MTNRSAVRTMSAKCAKRDQHSHAREVSSRRRVATTLGRGLKSATLLAATFTLLAGCNGSVGEPTTSSRTPVDTKSSTTASTSTAPTLTSRPTPTDADLAAAESAAVNYWAVSDSLAAHPEKSLDGVATVARGQAAQQMRVVLGTYRANGWRQSGRATVVSARAIKAATNKFSVVTCVDVRGVSFVDKNGPVKLPTRELRQAFTYPVEKTPQGFFVMQDTLKGTKC